MGGSSLEVIQDCVFGRKHHGGVTDLSFRRGRFRPKIDFRHLTESGKNLHTDNHLSGGC